MDWIFCRVPSRYGFCRGNFVWHPPHTLMWLVWCYSKRKDILTLSQTIKLQESNVLLAKQPSKTILMVAIFGCHHYVTCYVSRIFWSLACFLMCPPSMDTGIICVLTAAPSSEPVQVSMFCRHKNVNIALLMMPVKHHNVQTTRACESVIIEHRAVLLHW